MKKAYLNINVSQINKKNFSLFDNKVKFHELSTFKASVIYKIIRQIFLH